MGVFDSLYSKDIKMKKMQWKNRKNVYRGHFCTNQPNQMFFPVTNRYNFLYCINVV